MLPLLKRPDPMLQVWGHVRSIGEGCNEGALAPVVRGFGGADFVGESGGCGFDASSGLESFGLAFMGSYLPSATANVPDDEPSTN